MYRVSNVNRSVNAQITAGTPTELVGGLTVSWTFNLSQVTIVNQPTSR